ncbi:Seipin [Yarrowia sp. C11]|nr:Seipin [Yarrowia sp. C11]KAG5364626.1 Seipin [Yarrowia sp. E02]
MIILGLLLTYTPLGRIVKNWSAKRLWSVLYVLLWLLGIQLTLLFAAIAYVALYQFYIPVNSLTLPLDFDFSTEDGAYAVAKLHGDVVSLNYVEPASNALWKYVPFVSSPTPAPVAPHNRVTTFGRPRDRIKTLRFMNMPYSVYVNLDLPETDRNLGTGNFMIRVSFADDLEVFRSTHRLTRDNRKRWPLTHNEEYAVRPNVGSINKQHREKKEHKREEKAVLSSSSSASSPPLPLPALFTATRPAILAFQSATMRVLDTLLFAPLYLTGWRKQEQRLHVYMASNWHVPADVEDHEFAYAIVELDRTVDLYGAQIEWRVEWTGLRYFMYHHRIFAFLLGTAVLWYLEIFYLAIAYWSGKKVILKLTGESGTNTRPRLGAGGAGGTGGGGPGRPESRARIADDAALDADDPADETDTPDRSELHTRSSEIQQLLEDSETATGGSTIGDTTDNGSVVSQDDFSVEEEDDDQGSVSLSASDSNVEGYHERQSSRIEICAGDSDDNSQTIRYPVSWPTPPPDGPLALSRQEIESFTRYRYDQETPEALSRENTDSLSESDEFDFEGQLQIDLRDLVSQNRQERQERQQRLEELQAGPSGTSGRRTPDQRPISAPQRFSPRPPRSPAGSTHSSRGSSLRSSRLSTGTGTGTATGSNPSTTISRPRHVTPLTTPLPDESLRDDGDDESLE